MTNPVLEENLGRGPTLELTVRLGPRLTLQQAIMPSNNFDSASSFDFGKAPVVIASLCALVGLGVWVSISFFGENSASTSAAQKGVNSKSTAKSNTKPSGRAMIVNRSLDPIVEIYISSVRDNSWGNDLLGNDVLQSGFKMPLSPSIPGECIYDIRVVYPRGVDEERRQINLCGESEIIFDGR